MEGQVPSSSSSSRRTIVTKFVLENFKSYAGIREIGPMHKRFLAVVGPNGSGKSNLIDALLFIFGKRAKKLRMKNLSSLIHNSAEHPNAKEARVEIHFCEIDDADPITASDQTDAYNVLPDSEFVLSRTVRLDNTAFYCLNGKRQTFEEIETFMLTKGIDINNNRFLILQGEVEAISMMKPKGENKHEEGMLEFLEELIGTDRYVEDIEKSQALVEALSQNRALKLEQVKVGEKEMAALEGPKDEAVRFRFLEVSISETRCKILSSRLRQCEAKCVEAEQNKAAVSELFSNKKAEQDAIAQQASILDAEHKVKKEAHSQIVKALEEHKETYAKFERKHIKDEAKTKQLATKVEKNQAALEEARATKKQEDEKIFELESDLPNLALAVEKQEKALTQAEEELEQVRLDSREESRVIRDKIELKQKELVPLAEAASKAESEVNLLENELTLIEGPSKEAKVQLAEQEKLVSKLQERLTVLPKSKASLQEELDAAKASLPETDAILETLRAEETTLEGDVETFGATIRASQAGGSSSSKRSSTSKRLNDALKSGQTLAGCGLVGRLGDLGSIPDEYDTAATTASGSMLDAFVTRTTEDAERCVAFLRQENLPVSTFIILDQVKKTPMTSGPFPAPRLVDLVKPESEDVIPAFYHALRDTLVCADLDEATRVAYDEKARHRVVTLKGELIDRSGTMSGGGKPRKGGFGNSASAEDTLSDAELKDVQNKLDIAKKRLGQVRSEQQKETKLKSLAMKMIEDLESKLTKLTREWESVETKLNMAMNKLKDLEQQSTLSSEDLSHVESVRKRLEKTFKPERDRARTLAGKIEAELAELSQQMTEIGGAKGKALRDRVSNIRTSLDKARAALTKSQVALETSKATLKKAESQTEKLGGELELALAEQETHEMERKKTEEKASEALLRFKQATDEEVIARGVMEGLKREFNECKTKLNTLESGSVEMRLKMDSAEDEWKKALARKTKWESELSQAKSRLDEWRKTMSSDESATEDEPPCETDEDLARLENQVSRLDAEAKTLRGNVNMGAISEYEEREKEYLERVKELDEASQARDQARLQCDELKKKRLVEFMNGFSIISLKLKEIYQLITLGGDAELELVDSLDPFSEGVVFSVRPPKKSWKNISNLSGGEKTLSSLSLVFALHAFRGAPLYVMDEIDAALDFKNVSIVANYIKERTKNAQFLIISLRNNMFELADRLVGVYKTNNATKSVTINPDRVAKRSGIVSAMEENNQKEYIPPKSTVKLSRSVLSERDENIAKEDE